MKMGSNCKRHGKSLNWDANLTSVKESEGRKEKRKEREKEGEFYPAMQS